MANETIINETVDELNEELKIIELQRKIIEAQKGTLKALLPDSEVKALEGALSKNPVISVLFAHHAPQLPASTCNESP